MRKYTIKNSFHNTQHELHLHTLDKRASDEECERALVQIQRWAWQGDIGSKARIARARKTLCGVRGCTCGDNWGREKFNG